MKGRKAIVISRCLGMSGGLPGRYRFHFKGTVEGQGVRKVQLESPVEIEPGIEVMAYVALNGFRSGALIGKILKLKPVEGEL